MRATGLFATLKSTFSTLVIPSFFVMALVTMCVDQAKAGLVYGDPSGGWTYTYSGSAAAAGDNNGATFDALDAKWSENSDASHWDGSTIGTVLIDPNDDLPGGAMTITEDSTSFLRIQDTGDPGDDPNVPGGGSNNDNRRIGFVYNLSADGAADTILNDGVTLSFRARIPISSPLDVQYVNGGGTAAWPAGGKGYPVYSGGNGMFSIKQNSDDAPVGFSLTNAVVDNYSGPGLAMNSLNGMSPSGSVDEGEGTERLFSLSDATAWHEFWITIESGGAGTHQVTVYADGNLTGTTFDVTSGNGGISEYSDISYLAMTLGNTGEYGAVDVDFVSWKSGVLSPSAVPEPTSVALSLLAMIGLVTWQRNRG